METERPTAIVIERWGEVIIDSLDDPDEYHAQMSKLEEPVRHVISSELLLWQVDNGGFWQYFCNSYGIGIADAIAGLRSIGLPDYADIAERAKTRFGAVFQDDRVNRIEALGGTDFNNRLIDFDDLDDELYALDPDFSGGRYDVLDAYAQRIIAIS